MSQRVEGLSDLPIDVLVRVASFVLDEPSYVREMDASDRALIEAERHRRPEVSCIHLNVYRLPPRCQERITDLRRFLRLLSLSCASSAVRTWLPREVLDRLTCAGCVLRLLVRNRKTTAAEENDTIIRAAKSDAENATRRGDSRSMIQLVRALVHAVHLSNTPGDVDFLSDLVDAVGSCPVLLREVPGSYEGNLSLFAASYAQMVGRREAMIRIIGKSQKDDIKAMEWMDHNIYSAAYYAQPELLSELLSVYPVIVCDGSKRQSEIYNALIAATRTPRFTYERDDETVAVLLHHPVCARVWDTAEGRETLNGAFDNAADGGMARVAALLAEKGADPNCRFNTYEDHSPLYKACFTPML